MKHCIILSYKFFLNKLKGIFFYFQIIFIFFQKILFIILNIINNTRSNGLVNPGSNSPVFGTEKWPTLNTKPSYTINTWTSFSTVRSLVEFGFKKLICKSYFSQKLYFLRFEFSQISKNIMR